MVGAHRRVSNHVGGGSGSVALAGHEGSAQVLPSGRSSCSNSKWKHAQCICSKTSKSRPPSATRWWQRRHIRSLIGASMPPTQPPRNRTPLSRDAEAPDDAGWGTVPTSS
jgi:hypothetical protein